ncbi:MAG: agglutinin biogenesis protein MshI, partial [Janthinobacterium sp.]|nr:agglutinin biogenesis protein MshI [Janthinobacterium sp.]
MGLFARAKKYDGWLATAFGREGVSAVVVQRSADGMPRVLGASYQAAARPAPTEVLEKLGKDLQAAARHCTTVLAGGEYQL